MENLRVRIVYARNFSVKNAFRQGRPILPRFGSDLMRGAQLVEMIRPYLPEKMDIKAVGLKITRNPAYNKMWFTGTKPSVFILLKNVAYYMEPEQHALFRTHAVALGVDHIDGDLSAIDTSLFDFHISASHAGAERLRQDPGTRGRLVETLLHQPDPRILNYDFRDPSQFAPVYLGALNNAVLSDDLSKNLTILQAARPAEMQRALPRLPQFNFHFNVRPQRQIDQNRTVFKPFTKGVIAAVCKSNILVNRTADDAVRLLGEDYPYLTDSTDPARIMTRLKEARSSYGSRDWALGLDRMRGLAAQVSPKALAVQFSNILRQVA